MDSSTITKVGLILEINLSNGFYFKGRCVDENSEKIIILDKRGEKVEISKSAIILCKEIHQNA